jgi:hypothetical protein
MVKNKTRKILRKQNKKQSIRKTKKMYGGASATQKGIAVTLRDILKHTTQAFKDSPEGKDMFRRLNQIIHNDDPYGKEAREASLGDLDIFSPDPNAQMLRIANFILSSDFDNVHVEIVTDSTTLNGNIKLPIDVAKRIVSEIIKSLNNDVLTDNIAIMRLFEKNEEMSKEIERLTQTNTALTGSSESQRKLTSIIEDRNKQIQLLEASIRTKDQSSKDKILNLKRELEKYQALKTNEEGRRSPAQFEKVPASFEKEGEVEQIGRTSPAQFGEVKQVENPPVLEENVTALKEQQTEFGEVKPVEKPPVLEENVTALKEQPLELKIDQSTGKRLPKSEGLAEFAREFGIPQCEDFSKILYDYFKPFTGEPDNILYISIAKKYISYIKNCALNSKVFSLSIQSIGSQRPTSIKDLTKCVSSVYFIYDDKHVKMKHEKFVIEHTFNNIVSYFLKEDINSSIFDIFVYFLLLNNAFSDVYNDSEYGKYLVYVKYIMDKESFKSIKEWYLNQPNIRENLLKTLKQYAKQMEKADPEILQKVDITHFTDIISYSNEYVNFSDFFMYIINALSEKTGLANISNIKKYDSAKLEEETNAIESLSDRLLSKVSILSLFLCGKKINIGDFVKYNNMQLCKIVTINPDGTYNILLITGSSNEEIEKNVPASAIRKNNFNMFAQLRKNFDLMIKLQENNPNYKNKIRFIIDSFDRIIRFVEIADDILVEDPQEKSAVPQEAVAVPQKFTPTVSSEQEESISTTLQSTGINNQGTFRTSMYDNPRLNGKQLDDTETKAHLTSTILENYTEDYKGKVKMQFENYVIPLDEMISYKTQLDKLHKDQKKKFELVKTYNTFFRDVNDNINTLFNVFRKKLVESGSTYTYLSILIYIILPPDSLVVHNILKKYNTLERLFVSNPSESVKMPNKCQILEDLANYIKLYIIRKDYINKVLDDIRSKLDENSLKILKITQENKANGTTNVVNDQIDFTILTKSLFPVLTIFTFGCGYDDALKSKLDTVLKKLISLEKYDETNNNIINQSLLPLSKLFQKIKNYVDTIKEISASEVAKTGMGSVLNLGRKGGKTKKKMNFKKRSDNKKRTRGKTRK